MFVWSLAARQHIEIVEAVTYLAMIVGNKCDKHLRAVRLDVLETTCQIATGKRVA